MYVCVYEHEMTQICQMFLLKTYPSSISLKIFCFMSKYFIIWQEEKKNNFIMGSVSGNFQPNCNLKFYMRFSMWNKLL